MELEMPKTELKMASHENSYEVEEDSIISSVKEEPLVFVDEEQEHLPKAMEGLKGTGAAPFLKKTYEIIDDPNTDDIISWTSSTTSFVVWDPHKFSTHLLPNHFKHNNFSSFVRQLNTYRFRKIHPDRWEFANIGFQKGKKHLLKHIKRRKHSSQNMHQSISVNPRVDEEFEKLKTEQDILQAEILKLRQQQDNTQHYLAAVEERLRIAETKQKHMVIFMIKSLKNPLFLEHLIEKMKKKKRRLAFIDDEVQEELATVQSEIQTLFSSDDEHNSADENFVLWEKLMEDDMIYEAGREQYDIVLELEDLIAKPT